MPALDLIDETFIVAEPAVVAAALREPALHRRLFPDLILEPFMDRGPEGTRYTVTGALVGSTEFWVEPVKDGAVVHYYLRADLTARGSDREVCGGDPRRVVRRAQRAGRVHRRRLKHGLNALKDRLEADRLPGTPRG